LGCRSAMRDADIREPEARPSPSRSWRAKLPNASAEVCAGTAPPAVPDVDIRELGGWDVRHPEAGCEPPNISAGTGPSAVRDAEIREPEARPSPAPGVGVALGISAGSERGSAECADARHPGWMPGVRWCCCAAAWRALLLSG